MKILIDQSGYQLKNMGDLTMLQVAVARLINLWPDASIQVFTTAPERLVAYCPNTKPLSPSGREIWFSPIVHGVHKLMPNQWGATKWSNLERKFRDRLPLLTHSIIKFKLRRIPNLAKDFETFMQSIHNADLVVASGGGYITDEFKQHASSVLDTLALAVRLGKPIAMFGQGLGPISSHELFTKAKTVFPSVNLIALRESQTGIPLLNSIGVSQNRIIITGDDAIELVYRNRCEELSNGIGVNLRFAKYSNVNQEIFETVRSTLHDVAKIKNAPLIPVPISYYRYEYEGGYEEPDSVSIQKLLLGYDDNSDGGQSLNTPLEVIEQIGLCRVVVTGSYHAGVFALAQGIPIVGLAKSEYYVKKFLGLADQFRVGCQLVNLNSQQLKEKLVDSITTCWEISENLRPQILQAAKKQVELGQAAYKRVYELINAQ
ncbi:MAG: polysaccharide pyruvyl transferase family protein [Fischerella sp. CENA71]|nr:polysaccharide pyruvyl transferase family protein [Fischerella sp. CENA71]